MKLDIYENMQVIKTYESDTYDLMFSTLEDVTQAIDLDQIQSGEDVGIIKAVGKLVINSMDTVKNLLKGIFDGITDAEIRKAKVADIVKVIIEVAQYTIGQLNLMPKSKN